MSTEAKNWTDSFSTIQLTLSSPISTPPLEAAPELTVPNLDEAMRNLLKRAPPNGWWAESTAVSCLTPDSVITRWRQQSYPQNIGPIRPGDYRVLHDVLESGSRNQAVNFINEFTSHCQQCECSRLDVFKDEDGNPLLRPPGTSPETTGCEDQEKANSCMYLFGCVCEIIVYKKDEPSLTSGSVLGILGEHYMPPEMVGCQYKPIKKNPVDLGSMVHEHRGSVDGGAAFSGEGWLVSGTKEPYRAEGPDEGLGRNQLDWFPGIGGDLGKRSYGDGQAISGEKRDGVEDANKEREKMNASLYSTSRFTVSGSRSERRVKRGPGCI